jgi:hypothetical protein
MISLIEILGRWIVPDKKTYLISSTEDVANLPTSKGKNGCTYGSMAYTNDMQHVYMLGNDDVWREI